MKAPLIALCLGVAIATSTPLLAADGGSVQPERPATVFPGVSWETKRPEEVELSGGSLDEFARRVGGDGCIVKDGYLIKTWGNLAQHKDWASAAKPVLSTLLLAAVADGRLRSVDAPVKDCGWELSAKDRGMTFRHLANMVSGYACTEAPGQAWGYNDFAIQLYAKSLERVYAEPLDKAFRTRFAALQFEDGEIFGSRSGLGVTASPRDFARLGWLWLNHGRWGERDVVPASLFDACIRPGVPADLPRTQGKGADYLNIGSYGGGTDQTPHGPGVYGFNFWFNQSLADEQPLAWPALPADAYQANGMWNRDTVTVIPSLRMIVALRGAKLGPFEPGKADGAANQNLKLLVETAPQTDGPREETSAGWHKYENNPVLGGSLGTCFDVALLKEDGRYRMWFSWRPKESVALTESVDGVRWGEPTIVLEPRGATGWESRVNRPVVIKKADGYHMWYTGQSRERSWVGYARSTDGVHWRRMSPRPVTSADEPWEKLAVMCPHVVWDEHDRVFRMWYSGGEQSEPDAIGYATSPDGQHWTKHAGNPVFQADKRNAWEQHKVTACQVVQDGDWYLMFYIGFRDEHRAQIGLARSRDGVSGWERHPANPIISPDRSQWDHDACYKPFAICDQEKDQWLLWYNGRSGRTEQIGLAIHPGRDLGFSADRNSG